MTKEGDISGISRFRCISEGDDRFASTLNPKNSPETYSTSSSFQYASVGGGTPKPFGSYTGLPPKNKTLTSTYTSFDEIVLEDQKEEKGEDVGINLHHSLNRNIFKLKNIGSIDSGLGVSSSLHSLPSTSESIFGKSLDEFPSQTPLELPSWSNGKNELASKFQWKKWSDYVVAGVLWGGTLKTLIEFPLLAMQNGGGAFVLVYGLFLVVIGIPISFMMSALGQYSQCGVIRCWKISPIFIGVGAVLMSLLFVSAVADSAVASYSLLYIFGSFLKELPWTMCDGDWNSLKDCDRFDHVRGISVISESCMRPVDNCTSQAEIYSTALLFWENFNGFSTEDNELGLRWETFVSVGFVWFAVWLISINGFEFIRKSFYVLLGIFSVTFLAYFIRILLMRGGGIEIYFTFEYEKLGDIYLWHKAAGFTVRMAFASGLPLFLGSRNPSSYKVQYQTLLTQLILFVLAVLSSVAFFSLFKVNENLMYLKELDFISFAFVVPAEAFRSVPMNRLWSLLFFITIFSSQLGGVLLCFEAINASLEDYGDDLLLSGMNGTYKRFFKSSFISVVGLLCTLVFSSHIGLALYHTIVGYFFGITQEVVVLLVVIIVIYIYGIRNWSRILDDMIENQCFLFYPSWTFFCPIIFLFILCIRIYNLRIETSMEIVVAVLQAFLILQIPICAFCKFLNTRSYDELFLPSPDWGLRPRRVPKYSGTLLFSKKSKDSYKRDSVRSHPKLTDNHYSYY